MNSTVSKDIAEMPMYRTLNDVLPVVETFQPCDWCQKTEYPVYCNGRGVHLCLKCIVTATKMAQQIEVPDHQVDPCIGLPWMNGRIPTAEECGLPIAAGRDH